VAGFAANYLTYDDDLLDSKSDGSCGCYQARYNPVAPHVGKEPQQREAVDGDGELCRFDLGWLTRQDEWIDQHPYQGARERDEHEHPGEGKRAVEGPCSTQKGTQGQHVWLLVGERVHRFLLLAVGIHHLVYVIH
jgi:hypothetical protein